MKEQKAVVILIDNSCFSINSDFRSTRLEAEKRTIDLYSHQLFEINRETQIAIGCLAGRESGIRISFSNNMEKISNCIDNIGCDGKISLVKGIKTAILALNYCTIKSKQILIFVHSPHDLTDEIVDKILVDNGELMKNIKIDFVVFGKTVENIEPIRKLVTKTGSKLLEVRECKTVLSDSVLASKIASVNFNNQDEIIRNDYEIRAAIKISEEGNNTKNEQKPPENTKQKPKNVKQNKEKITRKSPKRNAKKK